MTKIKTFEFQITDYTGTKNVPMGAWGSKSFNRENKPRLYSQKEIENQVNKFMQNVAVVNVNIQFVTIDRHNNGGIDTVMEFVTVVYQE